MSSMSNVKHVQCQECQICQNCQMSRMSTLSNANNVKCQQFQMLKMSNVNNVKSVKIRPDQSRSYEIYLRMSKCQPNRQNGNQIVKMSIKLSNCHNIKCHVLSECAD